MLNYGYTWALEFHSPECEPSTLIDYRHLFVAPCMATSSYTHDMDGPWCQWTTDPGGDISGQISPANRVIQKQTWWGCQLLQWWLQAFHLCPQESIKKQIDMADQQAKDPLPPSLSGDGSARAAKNMDCRVVPSHTFNLIVRIVAKVRLTNTLVSCLHQSNLQ